MNSLNAPHNSNDGSAAWCGMIAAWLRPKLEQSRAAGRKEITINLHDLGKLIRGLEWLASKGGQS
jgi:hypothetical protein